MAFTNEDVQEIKEIVLETIEEESDPIENVQQVSELSDGDEVPIVRSSQGVNSYRRAPVNLFGGGGGVVIVNNLTTGGATKALSAEMGRVLKNMIPTSLSQLPDDNTHRTVTDSEKTKWNDKYTKTEVNNLISSAPESDVIVVEVPSGSDIATYLLNNVPAAQRPNNIFRVPGTTSYSEWAWDGTAYIMLANKDYGIDNEIDPESDNMVRNKAIASTYGNYINGQEWVRVICDRNKRFLAGIKSDGSVEWSKGIPTPIQKAFQNLYDYVDDKMSFFEGLFTIESNHEYIYAVLDKNRRFLFGVTIDGKFKTAKSDTNTGIDVFKVISDIDDRLEITLDKNKRVVSCRKKNGVLVENAGIETNKLKVGEKEIDVNGILNTLEIPWSGSHAMTILSVKKDGTGDFTTIQDAINSISDASVTNQYEVQVYDDFYVNDLTKLWKVDNPMVHGSSEPSVFVSYIVTKDFVHLRGVGGKRVIYVESPDVNMPGYCFKNIHTIFVIGNCRVENFVFKIKGGRYAAHQDKSSDRFGVDSFKTTIYKNIDTIHYGNSMYANGSAWSGTNAQSNGIANGQTQVYINVSWTTYEGDGAYYTHSNERFTLPPKLIYIGCKYANLSKIKTPSISDIHYADRYSCQNAEIYIFGCNMPRYFGRVMGAGSMNDNMFTPPTERGTKRYCLNSIIGNGNTPMIVPIEYGKSLTFTTKNNNERINVIGGTAFDDLWGVTYKEYYGNGIKGDVVGGNYIIPGVYSHVHSLPYILGNCANNPKTLVVRITDNSDNHTDHTIVFDKNYMTEDGSSYSYNTTPYISQSDIIEEVNSLFSSYFTLGDTFEIVDTFSDCKEQILNSGEYAVRRGTAMVKDYSLGYHCWRMANIGEKPEGFSSSVIAINAVGEVLLADKNLFNINVLNIWSNVQVGTFYKVGNNGALVQTYNAQEASMVAIDETTLCIIK